MFKEIKPIGGVYELKCRCGETYQISINHMKQTVEVLEK